MKTMMIWLNFVLVIVGFFALVALLFNPNASKDVFVTTLIVWVYMLLNTIALLKEEV
jgi:hypothetical protein